MRKGVFGLILLLALPPLAAQQASQLDTTTFVAIGEGLAAGLGDFSLHRTYQENSFPALMAQQMKTAFPQPLIQAPGIGGVPGFQELPVRIPGVGQTSVRKPFPPPLFVFNLAVPGHRLADAINLRPTPPLVQNDVRQAVTNMLLGFPAMTLGTDKPLWSQLEYAVAMNPTLALVELGYVEALEAAVRGDATLIPEPATFRADYTKVLSTLRANFAQVIATTIPDPLDTAYFSTIAVAAELEGVNASDLASRYGLREGDLLSPNALSASAVRETALPRGSVVSASAAAAVRSRVRALNSEINTAAQQAGAIVYDLAALFSRIRASGLTVGDQRLTADYMGGFYSLSGSYPGWTGHALIANEILALLNRTFGTSFSPLDLVKVAKDDPAVRFRATEFKGGPLR